ncbi:histidine ammonia-lyase [Fictibacillus macauensis ZFHKF-1]|uniref:Histidine ammonia-lyase n=1 Tax=Fictibacillus macauensis ZFHKF-1 TaxID=1196324 RepID=I8J204_9BACL|nr:histidine ammonia-lyase [Fictibacillus macauensis]EIT85781.1 histidine ammonia-lyase [Fictibacillus macauensis ZFHKF-1]
MILLTGHSLTLEEAKRIVVGNEQVAACQDSMENVKKSREAVERIVEQGEVIYGITTGFGKLSDVYIAPEDTEKLQLNLIRSHAVGVGEPFPEKVSKLMLVLRANALLKGFSGVRPAVVETLLQLVNADITPIVPQQGSLGASGDLAPLSHLALVLIGEGEVWHKGERKHAMAALVAENIIPLILTAKEGLALINGTQAMTAQGVVAYLEAEQLAKQTEAIAALTMEGLLAITDAFDPAIHLARGYQEQTDVAARILSLLEGSRLTTTQGEERVQDAYSIRCIPQVHGASWQALGYVKEKLEIEMNAATDNPLIFDEGKKVISGGNFHGQPIALAMDFLGIAMAEFANISERRIERMVNPQLNDLPAFLSPNPGLESGAMIMQYCAAALVSENKTLAHPASVDSIPSSANQEDHVSMGTIGARHAYQIITNARRVLAIEMICAVQAISYRDEERLAPKTRHIFEKASEICPPFKEDKVFSTDIERMTAWLADVSLEDLFSLYPPSASEEVQI